MTNDDDLTLRDLVVFIRQGLLVAIIVALVAAGATYYVNQRIPPTYQAEATLLVSAQDPNQRDFGVTLVTAPALDVATYQAAIRSRQVLEDALREATGTTPSRLALDELARSLTLRGDEARTSSIIRIFVTGQDPERARRLANGIAGAAVRWDQARATRSLETIIASLQAQIAAIDTELSVATDAPVEGLTRNRAELQLQLSSARALRTAAVGRLELLELADDPRWPVAPRPARNAALAGLLAAFSAYGLLLLRRLLTTRVLDPEQLAKLVDLPVLAVFPVVAGGRRKLPREAASFLRTAISFAGTRTTPIVILVTSATSMHGKSSVAMALAESYARQHFRTLLLDADLRQPVLGHEYGLHAQEKTNMRAALLSGGEVSPARVRIALGVEMDVLPSFDSAPNPTELIANHMPLLLERMKSQYDVIVIDSAPLLPVADSLTIAPHVSGVVFAVSIPAANRREVIDAVTLLRRIGARLYGTVATNLPPSYRPVNGGTRGYGYGYGSDP